MRRPYTDGFELLLSLFDTFSLSKGEHFLLDFACLYFRDLFFVQALWQFLFHKSPQYDVCFASFITNQRNAFILLTLHKGTLSI